jgi:hypothetical protein
MDDTCAWRLQRVRMCVVRVYSHFRLLPLISALLHLFHPASTSAPLPLPSSRLTDPHPSITRWLVLAPKRGWC